MNSRQATGSSSRRSDDNEGLRERARELRRADNPAEAALWAILRQRHMHGWKFRRQYVLGPFIADFYCAELRLVVEVDGLVHDEPVVRAHDRARDAWLEEHGIRVLRIPARLPLRDPATAVARIEAVIINRSPSKENAQGPDTGDVL